MRKYYIKSIFAFIVTAMMLTVVSCEKEADLVAISLDQKEISLVTGTSKTIKASVIPSGLSASGIVWSSSNTAVATVENGVVTAVAPGEAVITAKKGNISATCDVMVTASVMPVEGVRLNKISLEMSIGAEQQLVVGFIPEAATNRQVTWGSSNTDVATVSADGKVTSVAAGEAIITVTSADGNKTAQCPVNVKGVPVESVSLNKTELEVEVDEVSPALVAIINPAAAHIKDVTWSSSNIGVATVSADGRVTGVTIGTATITVTTVDGGKTAECEVVVTEKYTPEIFNIQLRGGGLEPIDGPINGDWIGQTHFKVKCLHGDPAFWTSYLTQDLPPRASKFKMEYKLSIPDGATMAGGAFVLRFVPGNANGNYEITASEGIAPTSDWKTLEIDISARNTEHPNWGKADSDHYIRIQLGRWFGNRDYTGAIWEIRNMRIEK